MITTLVACLALAAAAGMAADPTAGATDWAVVGVLWLFVLVPAWPLLTRVRRRRGTA